MIWHFLPHQKSIIIDKPKEYNAIIWPTPTTAFDYELREWSLARIYTKQNSIFEMYINLSNHSSVEDG